MLSSLLRPSRTEELPHRESRSPFSSPFSSPEATRRNLSNAKRVAADFDDSAPSGEDESGDDIDDENDQETDASEEDEEEEEQEDVAEGEDGVDDTTPLLPIFSAAHLDSLPVYTLTHAIRLLVASRCETTLSWDQLRSPQVSQFLLKPIQQEIRSAHFSSATQYALMANCLQFHKEVGLNPGNSGTSQTRAMVCELIAIKLLREFTARQLIDALAYDFDPFQGQVPANQGGPLSATAAPRHNWNMPLNKPPARAARISCLEIAIRAQAKRFLAHPLVVQQLEAIWAGSVVFHSAADSMHRPVRQLMPNQNRGYGTTSFDQQHGTNLKASPSDLQPGKQREYRPPAELAIRRTVTLYNPRDASLFKLSRLRVPRYRNLLSTCSFAVLLGLFLAVLTRKSLEITVLEIFFWFWAAGYMLDEVVGFNEQGFSLYIASFWNTFDLGILLILIVHLCLRLYSVLMPDTRKDSIVNLAYDVLAADAVLLFPRLFSVLDHYRYFSQLLIAFRMMASDLVAIFVLIIISCSGFFVAFTLGFGNDRIDTPGSIAYVLLQILMGFTPAAWDRWDGYNALGRTILTLFLFICHFLVVTILITVLTNSFMAIVKNANEEHQFVFAVNTISMVKSDALFSYVAPTNVIAWALTPLRYVLPFRRYVKVNRTVIKLTHFPILFLIFAYEKTILRSSVVDAVDLIESRGRLTREGPIPSRSRRLLRDPSIATFRQDRALEEVFREPTQPTLCDTQKSQLRRKTSTVVNTWMQSMDNARVSPPHEQDRSIVERLETGKLSGRRPRFPKMSRDLSQAARSVASDPEEFVGTNDFLSPNPRRSMTNTTPLHMEAPAEQAEANRNHKPVTNDSEKDGKLAATPIESPANPVEPKSPSTLSVQPDYFSRHVTPPRQMPKAPAIAESVGERQVLPGQIDPPRSRHDSPSRMMPKRRPDAHLRNTSTATILYNPLTGVGDGNVPLPARKSGFIPENIFVGAHSTGPGSGVMTPISKLSTNAAGHKTPKKVTTGRTRARPILPPKDGFATRSTPNLAGLMLLPGRSSKPHQRPSSLTMDIGSDIGDNKAVGGGYVGPIAASFGTQMAYATGGLRQYTVADDNQDMFARLMLARMNNLEESLREVVHEVRDHLRRSRSRSRGRSRDHDGKTKKSW